MPKMRIRRADPRFRLMRSDRPPLRGQLETADRVPPIHRGAQTGHKFGFGSKSKCGSSSLNFEAPPRLAVGLGRVPHDVTSVPDETPKRLDELLDRDLVARAEVDRIGPVVTFSCEHDPGRSIVDKQELPARRAVSPDLDVR